MSESNVKFTAPKRWISIRAGGRARSRSSRRSRWRPSATSAWPIRPASPCRSRRSPRIRRKAYDLTAKGNLVAVISNGTAILGLGNLGALASKPVMEGKAVLFKRFADVDSIDLEVDTTDAQRFIEARRAARAQLRRDQPRGHRRARLLHHRAGAEGADEHPGVPRRPARHRDHHRRRPDQRLPPDRPRAQGHQGRRQRRRRGGDRLHRADQGDGRAARQCHHVRPQGPALSGPRRHGPVQVGPCRADRGAQR